MGGTGGYEIEVWGLLFCNWSFLVILVDNVPMVSHYVERAVGESKKKKNNGDSSRCL